MGNTDEMRRLMLLLEAQQPDDEEEESDLDAMELDKRQGDLLRLLDVQSLGPHLRSLHAYGHEEAHDHDHDGESNVFLTFHNPASPGELARWMLEVIIGRSGGNQGKPQPGGYHACVVLQRAPDHEHDDEAQEWLENHWYKASHQDTYRIVQEIVGRDIGIVPGSIDWYTDDPPLESDSGWDNEYYGINVRPGSPLDRIGHAMPLTRESADIINNKFGNG